MGDIVIVGLGPGDGRLLTRAAWETLSTADEVHVRTARHPAVADFPSTVQVHSFDYLYEEGEDFAAVYAQIVDTVVTMAADNGRRVVYAVPGHPFVGESTVQGIVQRAAEHDIAVEIVEGLSFVEPMLTAIQIDGMEGVQIGDALEVAGQDYPQISPDRPLLLAQVYNRLVASELKLVLTAVYPDEHPVALVHGAGTAEQQIEHIHLYEIDHSEATNHLTSLYLPPLPRRSDMAALAETMAVLRGPNGCPWDKKQTPQSLRSGLLEETAELLDALDRDDVPHIREELGDLLMLIVMEAQMASEVGDFTLTDVIGEVREKMIRRHPHVWGETAVADSDEVVVNWQAIKAEEKAAQGKTTPDSLMDNIPMALPALARSQKMQKRVRRVGFDWDSIDGVYAKIQEELHEVRAAETAAEQQDELGDVLFITVNLAKWLGVDAETALREANLKFARRFRLVETLAAERGQMLNEMDEAALLAVWEEAKALSSTDELE